MSGNRKPRLAQKRGMACLLPDYPTVIASNAKQSRAN
jgi:hypothetical protein